jgi:hypothetical protein
VRPCRPRPTGRCGQRQGQPDERRRDDLGAEPGPDPARLQREAVEGEGWSGSHKAGDGVGYLGDLLACCVATFADGLDDAVAEVLFERAEGNGLERLGDSGDERR